MLRDGHWRTECEEDEKGAWEEATRLRERMFWARLGGGVVPASQLNSMRRETLDSPESVRAIKSARQSLESIPERSSKVVESGDLAEQELRPSSAARANVGTSSGVLATSRPDATPNGQAESDPVPSASDGSEDIPSKLEEASALQTASGEVHEQPTTPFEDTPADLSASQQESAAADQQLQNEIAAQDNSAEEKDEVPAPSIPVVNEPLPSSEAEVSTPPRPQPSERRPSAVLARVRAMEQSSQAGSKSPERKLPGGFD